MTESLKERVFEWLTWENRDPEGGSVKGTGRGLPTVVNAVVQVRPLRPLDSHRSAQAHWSQYRNQYACPSF